MKTLVFDSQKIIFYRVLMVLDKNFWFKERTLTAWLVISTYSFIPTLKVKFKLLQYMNILLWYL